MRLTRGTFATSRATHSFESPVFRVSPLALADQQDQLRWRLGAEFDQPRSIASSLLIHGLLASYRDTFRVVFFRW